VPVTNQKPRVRRTVAVLLAATIAGGGLLVARELRHADTRVSGPGLRGTNIGVYRPDTTEFLGSGGRPGFRDDPHGGFAFRYGDPGDVPVVGDWDGNGSQTPGVFRAGTWHLRNTLGSGASDDTPAYGRAADRPLVGDWDGDGVQTIGVQRGNAFLLSNHNRSPATAYAFTFGSPGDHAVVGDWDDDGVETIGVYRAGTWHLRNANRAGPADIVVAYGADGDVPVVGDWDSDGRVGIGTVRDGIWSLSNSVTSPEEDIRATWGTATDVPLVGNWGPTSQLFGRAPAPLARFFPIGVDFQPPSSFAKWKRRGINTVIRVPNGGDVEQWTRAANALGLRMIREPRPDPVRDEAEPNLVAFAAPDEPELGPRCSPECLAAQRASLKSSAPSKPYLVNLAGKSVLYQTEPGDPAGRCNGPGDAHPDSACIPRYLDAMDWVSHDIYPANMGTDIGAIGRILDRLRRWSERRPQFAYIEAADYNGDGRLPTPAQFRAEIWHSIIHGARGILYFVVDERDPLGRPDVVPPDIVAEMRRQNARITDLANVLQTPINPPTIGIEAAPPLEYTWRRVGSRTYVVVLNQSAMPVADATVKLLGVSLPRRVTVRGEGRILAPSGNAFTDSFRPYEVHIYEF